MEKLDLFKKKFSILQEISSAIVFTGNIGSIANLMLDFAISYTNAEKGSLMLISERDELHILAAKGIDTQFSRTYKLKIGEGIAGTVAQHRSPVLVEDIDKDVRFRDTVKRDRYKTKSFISCPIVSKNRLLGVLNINDKKNGLPFTEDEFELLKIIANHAAIALENAFLMTQLKTKAGELEEINKKLIDTDIQKTEFLTRISHELRTPLNSLKGAVYFLQQTDNISRSQQREFQGIISGEVDTLIAIVENLLSYLRVEDETKITKKTVFNIRDILKELVDSPTLKTMLMRRGIRLNVDAKEHISDIVGDKIKVVQMFINLVEGLCQYLERGDAITIRAQDEEFMNITVALSRAIPESDVACFYDARYMFRSDPPEEWLKLHLARNVVTSHRWQLSASNTDHQFQITIAIPKSTKHKIEAFIDTSMDLFVDFISELLDLDICSIMLSDELTNELTVKSARGLDDTIMKRTRIKFGDRIAGWVALEGKPLFIENIEDDPRFGKKSIPQYNSRSLISLPLKINGRVVGVLSLNNKKSSEPLTVRDYHVATVFGERISHFIELLYSGNYRDDEFKRFIASLEGLVSAEKRCQKKKLMLPDLVNIIMEKLGASDEDKKIAVYISLIYDLGLALVEESILNKKKLLPSETRTVKLHPKNAVSLLENFEYSEAVKSAILHHHERYDGKGYPDGLSGETIPVISRVLAVVDTFCAMISDRTYKKTYSETKALEEIQAGSGSHYDPQVVAALREAIQQR